MRIIYCIWTLFCIFFIFDCTNGECYSITNEWQCNERNTDIGCYWKVTHCMTSIDHSINLIYAIDPQSPHHTYFEQQLRELTSSTIKILYHNVSFTRNLYKSIYSSKTPIDNLVLVIFNSSKNILCPIQKVAFLENTMAIISYSKHSISCGTKSNYNIHQFLPTDTHTDIVRIIAKLSWHIKSVSNTLKISKTRNLLQTPRSITGSSGPTTEKPSNAPTVGTAAPISPPTPQPTPNPTFQPTKSPTNNPSVSPTNKPTNIPTVSPTNNPTYIPTESPTNNPTNIPTVSPTNNPSVSPTNKPTNTPTISPTNNPTNIPSVSPTNNPSVPPTHIPTSNPTNIQTESPTNIPTSNPSVSPTNIPTISPTNIPTIPPTNNPTNIPTISPTIPPTGNPTNIPIESPTNQPTISPTSPPTKNPSILPTANPTKIPTNSPSNQPISNPTLSPTYQPSVNPTYRPLNTPTSTTNPTHEPSSNPTNQPTKIPSLAPTNNPTLTPSQSPITPRGPTHSPTNQTNSPSNNPTIDPTEPPSISPTSRPTRSPTQRPTSDPTQHPTLTPTALPTALPIYEPTKQPSESPMAIPATRQPTVNPTESPSHSATLTNNPTNSPIPAPTKYATNEPSNTPKPSYIPSTSPTDDCALPYDIRPCDCFMSAQDCERMDRPDCEWERIDREYWYVADMKSWRDADRYCTQTFGTNLATIIDDKDMRAAVSVSSASVADTVWIGLFNECVFRSTNEPTTAPVGISHNVLDCKWVNFNGNASRIGVCNIAPFGDEKWSYIYQCTLNKQSVIQHWYNGSDNCQGAAHTQIDMSSQITDFNCDSDKICDNYVTLKIFDAPQHDCVEQAKYYQIHDLIVDECFLGKRNKSKLIHCSTNGGGYTVYQYNNKYCTGNAGKVIDVPSKICPQSTYMVQEVQACASTSLLQTPAPTIPAPITCGETVSGDYNNIPIDFEFRLTTTAQVIFDSCSSDFDTLVQLYDSSKTQQIDVSEDGCELPLGQSQLVTELPPGTYYYRLSSLASPFVFGAFDIEIFCIQQMYARRRLNDVCVDWTWIDGSKCGTATHMKNTTVWPTIYPLTSLPTGSPISTVSQTPSHSPTRSPSNIPTLTPTNDPTQNPTHVPTKHPSLNPTMDPTEIPTVSPTSSPTNAPFTQTLIKVPTQYPTAAPAVSAPAAIGIYDDDISEDDDGIQLQTISFLKVDYDEICSDFWQNYTVGLTYNYCGVLSVANNAFIPLECTDRYSFLCNKPRNKAGICKSKSKQIYCPPSKQLLEINLSDSSNAIVDIAADCGQAVQETDGWRYINPGPGMQCNKINWYFEWFDVNETAVSLGCLNKIQFSMRGITEQVFIRVYTKPTGDSNVDIAWYASSMLTSADTLGTVNGYFETFTTFTAWLPGDYEAIVGYKNNDYSNSKAASMRDLYNEEILGIALNTNAAALHKGDNDFIVKNFTVQYNKECNVCPVTKVFNMEQKEKEKCNHNMDVIFVVDVGCVMNGNNQCGNRQNAINEMILALSEIATLKNINIRIGYVFYTQLSGLTTIHLNDYNTINETNINRLMKNINGQICYIAGKISIYSGIREAINEFKLNGNTSYESDKRIILLSQCINQQETDPCSLTDYGEKELIVQGKTVQFTVINSVGDEGHDPYNYLSCLSKQLFVVNDYNDIFEWENVINNFKYSVCGILPIATINPSLSPTINPTINLDCQLSNNYKPCNCFIEYSKCNDRIDCIWSNVVNECSNKTMATPPPTDRIPTLRPTRRIKTHRPTRRIK